MDIGARLKATAGDFERIYELLVEASIWLRQRGVGQWQQAYPRDRLAREVAAGCVWYWVDTDELVATATLYETRPEYYPRGVWEDHASAWYVCRFAVARRFAGRRLGELALRAVERDAKIAGVRVLRLDVTTANPFLERYYLAQGFQVQQVVEIFGEPCALLEKTLEVEW